VFDRLVDGIFDRRWFTNNGELVRLLEAKLCKFLGVRHCILVCNGTVGLQIACHALELTGEVILPAFTFIATAHALQWERLTTVFVDVDPITHNLDPHKLEALITDNTSAILGVHVWGRPCDTATIHEIATHHDVVVIYDAAHSFGCRHQGQMIGNFGRCEIFSFHATKFFNTFEGGAIATNDDALAEKLRLMRNFGFAGMDNVIHLGTNGKMPEVCAAMGLACFEKMDEIVAINRRNYNAYRIGLKNLPGLRVLDYDGQEKSNFQYVVVEVDENEAVLTRDELMRVLHINNVRARRYFFPGCHRSEPYRSLYPDQQKCLPMTDRLCRRVMCLPTGTSISCGDVEAVCGIIRTAIEDVRIKAE
jgi:dTDP-4-amino-4,6-dideoxygalactose transaminase